MHLLLYCKHQCAPSNKCTLQTCGNKHIFCSKQMFNLTLIYYYFDCLKCYNLSKNVEEEVPYHGSLCHYRLVLVLSQSLH